MGTRAKAKLPKRDIEAVERLMDLMLSRKMFHVEVDGIKIEASQYAFAPSVVTQPVISRPTTPPEILNPAMQAFRPWAATKPAEPEEPELQMEPVDPGADIDDERLFGTDLPQEH